VKGVRRLAAVERWIWCPDRRPGARLQLLCFPHAGGTPAVFRHWAGELPADVELLAARLPGRQSRLTEPAYRDWVALLAELSAVVATAIDRPFALFGHSLGAMICYELARTLRAVRPARLLLAACRAPDVPSPLPPVHRLPDVELARGLPLVARIPPEVLADPRMMRLVLPTIRADLTLTESWPPTRPTPLGVPATVFVGRADPVAPPSSARGWSRFAAPVRVAVLDGDHFFVHSDRTFVHHVRAELARLSIVARPPPR